MSSSRTIRNPTYDSKVIRNYAVRQLIDYPLKKKVRLIGVAVSNLTLGNQELQMSLFVNGDKTGKERKVDEAMDEIQGKFGGKIIKRGDP